MRRTPRMRGYDLGVSHVVASGHAESEFVTMFSRAKPVIGVSHVGALPGTPRSSQAVSELTASAKNEARLYRESGVDGVIIENMHDVQYLRGEVGPEIVAAMTAIAVEVKHECGLPVGVQLLAGANIEAMAVAHAAGLDFIRAEGYRSE